MLEFSLIMYLLKLVGLITIIWRHIQLEIYLYSDHLQGVTISRSKLFTVHGDQPQPLIWDGHGFELYLPANTCLPNENCEIIVDAVVGGHFVFPKGVEPVSAIYIISVPSKPHKPCLLKIQHCVALDKASKHSHLSFYRASLKETKPPYHFKRIKGGTFDTHNQFGELELPAFCGMAIGKYSTRSSSTDESSSDPHSAKSNNMQECPTILLPGNREFEMSDSADGSIIFFGQAFYLRRQINQWHFKFIVVKNLDAFTDYVRSNLTDHDADAQTSLRFSANHIELVLDRVDAADFKGWNIEPHVFPCTLPLKHAASFGYEKKVSVPPTCLVTVVGDNSVQDYVKGLHYPVPLRGAIIGDSNQQAKIFIKRMMEEKGTRQQSMSRPSLQRSSMQISDVSAIVTCIREEINSNFAPLKSVFDTSIDRVSAELFTVGIISDEVKRNPSTDAILTNFYAGFAFMKELPDVVQHCIKFFSIFGKIGGPFIMAGNSLKQDIVESINRKLDFNISFD